MTTTSQALDYLESTVNIPAREMSKAIYKYLNSCARLINRTYPGMIGYYDPEFNGQRIDLSKHLHFVHRENIKYDAMINDPFADSSEKLFGIKS
jgi:hypothetical protein